MMIGICGASGRTDATHCALLVARALITEGGHPILLVAGRHTCVVDGSLPLIRIDEDEVEEAATVLSTAFANAAKGTTVIADLPRRLLERDDVRRVLHIALVVVGPHRLDEHLAGTMASAGDIGPSPWYLAWRRDGGAPAAERFAAVMIRYAPGVRILPVAVPPLGIDEAAALDHAALTGRSYRSGLDLLSAIRKAAGGQRTDVPGSHRTAVIAETGAVIDRLRDLIDSARAPENDPGPRHPDTGDLDCDDPDRDELALDDLSP